MRAEVPDVSRARHPDRPVTATGARSGRVVPELLLRLPLADPGGAGRAARSSAHVLLPLRARAAAEARPGTAVSVCVAYPGRDGAHAATATEQLFPEATSVVPLPSFSAVVEATTAGAVDFGVLPIESSLSGSVAETHDLLHVSGLSIAHETVLPIRH